MYEKIKKIVRSIGVFIAGVFAGILGAIIRNHGKSVARNRAEQSENAGSIDECREQIRDVREQLGDGREAAARTSEIIAEVRKRQKDTD